MGIAGQCQRLQEIKIILLCFIISLNKFLSSISFSITRIIIPSITRAITWTIFIELHTINTLIIRRIIHRCNTLAGTKDVVSCTTGSNLGIALNLDSTCSTCLRIFWKSTNNMESAHRGYLATTIDTATNLSFALNSDFSVATYQSGIAMCGQTSTGTEHAARNSKLIRSILGSYRHLRVIFHTAYLTAAIDVTIHRTLSDADIRGVRNSFLTPPRGGTTPARSEHISMFGRLIST